MATTTLNGTRRNVWIPGEWRLNGSRWRRSLHETGSTTPGSRKRRVASPLIGCRGTCFAVAVARSCQDIYANRGSSRLSFRLYALRFSWRICIRWIDSLSLSFPLSRTPFYFYLLLATYTCEYVYIYIYVYISSHRVTHDNIGQFAYETRRYSLFQTSLFYPSLPLSLSLHAPINRCRDERSFPRWPCLSCSTGLKRERVARLNEIDCLRKNKWNAWYKLCTVTRTLSYSKILIFTAWSNFFSGKSILQDWFLESEYISYILYLVLDYFVLGSSRKENLFLCIIIYYDSLKLFFFF